MTRSPSKETAYVSALPFWGGVELLRARFVTQRFSRHFHEGFAVGCIEDGAMRFRYRGESVVAARGQVNLVVPGEPHDGHGAGEAGWTYRMFYLSPDALMAAARELVRRPELPHFRAGVLDDPALAACIDRTHRRLERPETSLMEKKTRLLGLLTAWIARHADDRRGAPRAGREHRAVNRAREIIEDRFAEDLPLSELAREAGLSPFHLVRVFERQLGVTPHAFLTQTRVERARRRLAGEGRVADIAMDCGFADQAHLTRLFKRQTGVTPANYRKMLQNS
ncbi:AraC family transcriptional regulator [Desulfovibrio sp. Huiquan2017]|uniref:AraC family transcriptional regulator n=1 Tax=Desulfovibrio sp. Huiquan2017 TaxID=2816861 RepID=UPI001A9178D6|nr:AraC family transcriptional regulator [Desulfovibrio sp. Huiquan2017]